MMIITINTTELKNIDCIDKDRAMEWHRILPSRDLIGRALDEISQIHQMNMQKDDDNRT